LHGDVSCRDQVFVPKIKGKKILKVKGKIERG
jgi:hypothetical protein